MNFGKDQFDSLKHFLGIRVAEESQFGGIDYFLPLFEKMRSDSSIVIIKVDGEREENIYTVLVSGNPLGVEGSIRKDASSLVDAISYVTIEYAKRVWGWSDVE
ncbi:hypothetical protein [Paenibacillus ehimensis]|uniref:Uncharacterized protein n=1 Tax=Paenibacillus ehimensis TaxID=79264 RepID=A0ABT8V5K5_9BACL|nr:hypothetical protein [Paenibacillus ehimensis]MDO3676718.1 hypothetical protein [Paenibacillus ehimensis]